METNEKQKMFEAVIQKAWEDVEFKAQLIAEPVKTLEDFLGQAITPPEGKKIAFIDQSDSNTLFINIPQKPNLEDMELNENQLDAVAGGGDAPILTPPDENFSSIL